jgi:GNAT superfamily N-acetyltransferase
MAWHTTNDLDEFDATTAGYLAADRGRHTLLLTVPQVLRRRGMDAYGDVPPMLGWHQTPDGGVDAVFLQTPPHPLVLSELPPGAAESVEPLIELLAAVGPDYVTGINAPNVAAETFATAWHARTGAAASVHMRQRLYRLGTLTPLAPAPPGAPRIAGEGDRDLLIAWYVGFGEDIGEAPLNIERIVDDRISFGGLTLWEVDGEPVAMAGALRPVAGTVRVAPVYTPRQLRGRGYAGAVTAEVSRQALALGAEVLLFTDLANPTSNSLYQRLGYREVEDRIVLGFGRPGGAG